MKKSKLCKVTQDKMMMIEEIKKENEYKRKQEVINEYILSL